MPVLIALLLFAVVFLVSVIVIRATSDDEDLDREVDRKNVELVRESAAGLTETVNDLVGDVRSLKSCLAELREDVTRLEQSTGGMWRTARGDVLQLRHMSDDHLANAIQHLEEERKNPDLDVLDDLHREVERREVDRQHRAAEDYERNARMTVALATLRRAAVTSSTLDAIAAVERELGR